MVGDIAMMQNAFTSVRPRGPDIATPAALPKRTNTSKAPKSGNVHLLLDTNGRKTVGIERRTKGGITIESRAESQASVDKRKRISKQGSK